MGIEPAALEFADNANHKTIATGDGEFERALVFAEQRANHKTAATGERERVRKRERERDMSS